MKLFTVRYGSTLFAFDKTTQEKGFNDLRKSLKPNGDGLIFSDSHREFIEDVAVVDTSKSGADQYTWDKTGNKVLHRRVYVTVIDGKRSEKLIRKVYKALD